MKRRAILELVCRLRKDRDFWRNLEKQGAATYNDEYYREKDANFRAGMWGVVQERKGLADGFHLSAHRCMGLFGR